MSAKVEYLYGDATASPLKTDYIGFLQDAVDFAVEVLLRDEQVADAMRQVEELAQATEKEIEAAEALFADVWQTIDNRAIGDSSSLAGRCAAAIRQSATDLIR